MNIFQIYSNATEMLCSNRYTLYMLYACKCQFNFCNIFNQIHVMKEMNVIQQIDINSEYLCYSAGYIYKCSDKDI